MIGTLGRTLLPLTAWHTDCGMVGAQSVCGICGIVPSSPDCVPDEATLCAMCEALRHRGPDSRGLAVGPGYGLGFQRLAIIGLANGEQPIWNEDRTLALVCNGEIYNHIELRRELEQAGHRFRTDSDAEVILHLFEQHGTQSLSRLRGMFAFALLDAPRRRLVLARDRFGIKPLCWSDTGDAFLFASEAKAIFQHPAAARKIDAAALARLIQYGFVPGEATLFEGIRQVPPGHSLVYENGRLHLDRYWGLPSPTARHTTSAQVRRTGPARSAPNSTRPWRSTSAAKFPLARGSAVASTRMPFSPP